MADQLQRLLSRSQQLVPPSAPVSLVKTVNQLEEASRKLVRDVPMLDEKSRGLRVLDDPHGRQLRELDMSIRVTHAASMSEVDVEEFISINYENSINAAIEESNKQMANAFMKMQSAKMESDWEAMKQEYLVCQSFSKVSVLPEVTFPHAPVTSLAGSLNLPANVDSFGKVVSLINGKRLSGTAIAAATAFEKASLSIPVDSGSIRLSSVDRDEMWSSLKFIVGESTSAESRIDSAFNFKSNPLYEKQYESLYLKKDNNLTKDLVSKSLCYLESLCYSVIRDFSPSKIHGVDFVKDIKTWLQLTGIESSVFQSAVVYYCFRCGRFDDAISEAGNVYGHPALINALKYHSQILPENLWRSLYSEYSEWKSQGISDPYIQCLYLVLGRIESRPPSTLANLLGTTEDFLWFLLSCLWLHSSTLPSFLPSSADALSLESLQSFIQTRGASHFSLDGQAPLRYSIILLLTLQFEEAIAYLLELNSKEYVVDTIHWAIILNHYGLLRREDALKESLVIGKKRSINLGALVSRYIESFSLTHPSIAIEYLINLISSNPSKIEDESAKALAQFLVKIRNYDTLIGFYKDGNFHSGLLFERFRSCENKARAIIVLAADIQSERKDDIDAIKLFLLAREFNKAGSQICQALSDALDCVPISSLNQTESAMNCLMQLAQINPATLDPNLALQLDQMYLIGNYFQQCSSKQYDSALSTLAELQICPTKLIHIDSAVGKVKSMDPLVAHHIPRICSLLVSILREKYLSLKSSIPDSRITEAQNILRDIKEQITTLAEFISRISCNISVPSHILEQIVTTRAQL